jgi:hypothetical protein
VGSCEDVDVVYWGNGAFSAADESSGVQFWRCRARDGIDSGPNNSIGRVAYDGTTIPDWAGWVGPLNRRLPLSGSEAFFAYRSFPNVEYHQCHYHNLPRGVAWDRNLMTVEEFSQINFTPRGPISLTMPWERAT